jgi:chromosome segregation ATPase
MAKAKKPRRLKEEDIPVSMKHLMFFKQEVMGAITTLTLEMREGFAKIDARFAEQDARFSAIESRFSDIDSRFAEQDAKFAAIDARFDAIDARFVSIDARFSSIDARFASFDARFASIETRLEKIETKIVQVKVTVEEQNDRNKAALDGYITVYEKLIEHDGRFQRIEKHIGLH